MRWACLKIQTVTLVATLCGDTHTHRHRGRQKMPPHSVRAYAPTRSSMPHPRAPPPDPRLTPGPVFVVSGGVISKASARDDWERDLGPVRYRSYAPSFFLPIHLSSRQLARTAWPPWLCPSSVGFARAGFDKRASDLSVTAVHTRTANKQREQPIKGRLQGIRHMRQNISKVTAPRVSPLFLKCRSTSR